MNKSYAFKRNKVMNIKMYLLFVSIFFLPLNMNLNNIFLVLFFAAYIFEGGFKTKFKAIQKNIIYILPIIALFFMIGLGYFYSFYSYNALKQIERSFPFLIIPIIFISQPKLFADSKDKIFYSLVFGCLIATFISWTSFFYYLISQGDIHRIFFWEHSKLFLIKNLDQHTPYLSMFLFSSIGFLMFKARSIKKQKYKLIMCVGAIVLFLFLLHLLSRTAIVYFVVFAIIYLISNNNKKLLIGFLIIIIAFFTILLNSTANKSEYYKRLLFEQTGVLGGNQIDGRFVRWKYSWELFKENPILGTGTGDVDVLRTVKYRENNDIIAYKAKYNAHNQFFEIISAQGIIGGIIYVSMFIFLFYLAIKNREYLFLFVIFGVFICCLTESMFRRSWGIVFFSLMSSLLISCILFKKERK